jgi:hypothetical protein
MSERSLTPSITVTIGHHTRLYFAFITTAPPHLDTPATITLLADTLLEVACYAADPSASTPLAAGAPHGWSSSTPSSATGSPPSTTAIATC